MWSDISLGETFDNCDQSSVVLERVEPASSGKPAHVHVVETKRGEEAAKHDLGNRIKANHGWIKETTQLLLTLCPDVHLGRVRVGGNWHRFDTLLRDLLEEISGDSVERLHHHRSRWQACSQLLCLAELI